MSDPTPARRKASWVFRSVRAVVFATVVATVCAAGGLVWFLKDAQRTPREWAPYLERRAEGHRSTLVDATDFVGQWLRRSDRLAIFGAIEPPLSVGARPERSSPLAGRFRTVNSIQGLRDAMGQVQPGDVLVLAPGVYKLEGSPVHFARSGTPSQPMVFRAARLGEVTIESNTVESFKVSGAYWRFENLIMRAVCGDHTYCEHAFHVVGGAEGAVFRNNRLVDFNAHFKINGENGRYPDNGTIEYNALTYTQPRATRNPITPIDLVAASNWRIADNFIADFVRAGGGGATYGAFVKGAGEGNTMERNVVFCEWKLTGLPGERIGLSFGGGGTGPTMTRDNGQSGLEQFGGVIRDNLIAFCSDLGIYANKARNAVIEHNTLIDTAGIDIRFKQSSAEVRGNIVDGVVRGRDDGVLTAQANEAAEVLGLFMGKHPQREFYRNAATLDLRWRTRPAALAAAPPRKDLCGAMRPAQPTPGAFEDFASCASKP